MNADGKSDGVVVPSTQANNAGAEPAAESAEGRDSAQRNTDENGLYRTPSRNKRRSFGLAGVTRRHGWFTIHRETMASRLRATLATIKVKLVQRRHWTIGSVGVWLARVMRGWLGYHAIPGNMVRCQQFRDEITKMWLKVLRTRSQRHRWTWSRMQSLVRRVLPTPKIIHPYPQQRFRARLEAGAV